jgi:hypothetical protein
LESIAQQSKRYGTGCRHNSFLAAALINTPAQHRPQAGSHANRQQGQAYGYPMETHFKIVLLAVKKQ